MNREELKKKRAEHLDAIRRSRQPEAVCLHDTCPNCWGTGIKLDGSPCIHMISCPCPKHSMRMSS